MAKRKPADTPLMRQYLDIKTQHPDAILFFRLGDFYEMFFEDAVLAAQKLDLTLTSRDKGHEDAVPMCGVPHHAARGYIARLTDLGFKVVLCEQVEDPKQAKGLVRREVVRIITPGVVLDDEVLDPKSGRYLAAITTAGAAAATAAAKPKGQGAAPEPAGEPRFGLAYLDVSTGEFRATEVAGAEALVSELARVQPREVLASERDLSERGQVAPVSHRYRAAWGVVDPASAAAARELLERELAGDLRQLGLAERPLAARAAADVVLYARATQPAGTLPICRLQVYEPGQAVVLDETAVANLELCTTLMGGKREGSLLGVLDRTCTAPGGRLLRRWLLYPLAELAPIRRRHDAVEFLVEHASLRQHVRDELAHVYDIERLTGRVSLGVATPRDLGRLRDSLARLPELAEILAGRGQGGRGLAEPPELLSFEAADLAELAAVERELRAALVDDPPVFANQGGIVRDGFCDVVDANRRLADGGKEEIAAIEERERQRTGISSLKVKYNKVFGYYLEVTRSHLARVPEDYVRKQTIANGERFVTAELADLEQKVMSAQETLIAREQELLGRLCEVVSRRTAALMRVAARVAAVDCLAALAEVAHRQRYVRPEVDEGERLEIVEGRHPVVERMVEAGSFVPNDCTLDPADRQILLITGPNMAGKSTFMRQVAQIVLLAQMGSFVPAARARVGLVDRVFTRVGAADNLARGESTFMVEMRETSAILAGATRRSLVVLDEVGRGTSTFDGVSIAWAVTEYLHDAVGARTLFATHYHELAALADARPRVHNVSVAVREHKNEIVFLRQVVDGAANRSYGIDVARLAGLPRSVVARARHLLEQLEGAGRLGANNQLTLFQAANTAPIPPQPGPGDAILERLRAIDPNAMTPLDALQLLAELKSRL